MPAFLMPFTPVATTRPCQVWIAPVSAILPGSGGYHVRWYGLWMEEARGITLHGLHMSRSDKLVQEILVHKLNQTQVGRKAGEHAAL
jgi:hypothetical protein